MFFNEVNVTTCLFNYLGIQDARNVTYCTVTSDITEMSFSNNIL